MIYSPLISCSVAIYTHAHVIVYAQVVSNTTLSLFAVDVTKCVQKNTLSVDKNILCSSPGRLYMQGYIVILIVCHINGCDYL